MTLSFKRVRRRGARLAHNKHSTQGWCVLYSCLVLCRLLLSCLVFDCFLSSCILLSCIILSCLVFLCPLCSCLVVTSSFLISLRPSLGIVLISGASRSKETTQTTNGLCLPLSCHYLVLYSLVLSCLVLGLCVFFSFFISSLVLYCLTLCCLVWSSVIVFCHVLASITLLSVLLSYLVLSGVGFSFLTYLSSTSGVKANTNITQNYRNALRL